MRVQVCFSDYYYSSGGCENEQLKNLVSDYGSVVQIREKHEKRDCSLVLVSLIEIHWQSDFFSFDGGSELKTLKMYFYLRSPEDVEEVSLIIIEAIHHCSRF